MTDADHFKFTGNGVSVDYVPMGAGAVPHLTYQDSHRTLRFSDAEIRKTNNGLRGAVTVDLEPRIGLNIDTFTLFVPEVRVADGERAEVTTVGLTTETLGGALPDSLPLPIDRFTAIQMDGFAEKRTGNLPRTESPAAGTPRRGSTSAVLPAQHPPACTNITGPEPAHRRGLRRPQVPEQACQRLTRVGPDVGLDTVGLDCSVGNHGPLAPWACRTTPATSIGNLATHGRALG